MLLQGKRLRFAVLQFKYTKLCILLLFCLNANYGINAFILSPKVMKKELFRLVLVNLEVSGR